MMWYRFRSTLKIRQHRSNTRSTKLHLPDSHALLNICRADTFSQIDNELGNLLNVDHIFVLLWIFFVRNDLGAAGHLERLFLSHSLMIGENIPQVWWCETRIGFLRRLELDHRERTRDIL